MNTAHNHLAGNLAGSLTAETPDISQTMGPKPKRNPNDSPDEIIQGAVKAPDSKNLEAQQTVPPSPTSDQVLGSPDALGDDTMELGSDDVANDLDTSTDPVMDTADFYAQHIADLATHVALVLSDTVSRNDRTPFSTEKLTRFHSRAPPGISIRDYIMRIIKFCNLDKAVLLVLLYLVDLFTSSYPRFTLNSLTVHRFLITACTVAAKGLCDQFCSNTHYAKVGGVSVMELNLLEVEFLTRVSYRIVPPQVALSRYYSQIQSKRLFVQSNRSSAAPALQIQGTQVPGGSNTQSIASKSLTGQSKFGQNRASQIVPNANANASKNASKNASLNANANANAVSSDLLNRKHAREDSLQPTISAPDREPIETRNQPQPPGKASGNKGFKAMKDTFRFLNPSKKKRGEDSDP